MTSQSTTTRYVRLCTMIGAAIGMVAGAGAQEKPRGRLLFFGVAYDEAPGPGLTIDNFNYAPDNFTTLFAAQSKDLFREMRAVTAKGDRATYGAVAAMLQALRQAARRDDVVFLYWGTHGGTDSRGWSANLPGDGHVLGSEIKAALALVPCPVIVAISTCGSGGFARPTGDAVDLPRHVAAFCACRRRQSTGNQLDVALLEALAGFGDSDGNGRVTLGEVVAYVPKRYRRLLHDAEGADVQPVIAHGADISLDVPLTKTSESCAAAVFDGAWYGAMIQQETAAGTKVRFLGYDSTSKNGGFAFPDALVPHDHLDRLGGLPPIEVESEGKWYPATPLSQRSKGWKIHYVGYPTSDDEVVPPKRMRFPFVGGAEALRAARTA